MKRMLFAWLAVYGLFVTALHAQASSPDTWNGSEVDISWYTPADSGTDSYTISSAAQLAGLAAIVNGTATGAEAATLKADDFLGKTITLTADIDLDNKAWTPIGKDNVNTFAGVFDGGGKTVSNLSVTSSSTGWAYAGLFGRVEDTATPRTTAIKNLTIKNVSLACQGYGVGAVVGHAMYGKEIVNCHVTGKIAIEGSWYIGGLAGRIDYIGTVSNCSVVGENGSYIRKSSSVSSEVGYMGGIVGYHAEGNLVCTECRVEGVAISGDWHVGGISGIVQYGNTISKCSVKNVTISTTTPGGQCGLIAGNNMGATTTAPSKVLDCTVENTTATANGSLVTKQTGTNRDGNSPSSTIVGTGVAFDAAGKVTAGTFETLTADTLAENVAMDITPEGSITLGTSVVASIGQAKYASLTAAITAAKSGETVKLEADVDLTNLPGGYNVFDISGVVLDLNDKTITVKNNNTGDDGTGGYAVFQGVGAKITNGTFAVAESGGNYALFIGDEGETNGFVVEDVTASGINGYNATNVTLKGVTCAGGKYYSVWCDENAHVTIESGTYSSAGGAVLGCGTSSEEAPIEMVVQGGTFTAKDETQPIVLPSNGSEAYTPPQIEGGSFNKDMSEENATLGENLGWTKDATSGNYGVRKVGPIQVRNDFSDPTASGTTIGTVYDTLAEAFGGANAQTNKVVAIVGNVTLSEDASIPQGIYLDIWGTGALTVTSNATLTIAENCKRFALFKPGATLTIDEGAKVLLQGGSSGSSGTLLSGCFAQFPDTFFNGTLTLPEGKGLYRNNNNMIAVSIESAVAKVECTDGPTYYAVDGGQFNNVLKPAGCTLTLLNNVTGTVLVKNGDMTLDLGGKILTGTTSQAALRFGSASTVTVRNGTIQSNSTGSAPGLVDLMTSGKVIIESSATLNATGNQYAVNLDGYPAEIIINGTVSAQDGYAITMNGTTQGPNNVTINQGAKVSSGYVAIYHTTAGKVAIAGGEVSGHTAIYMRSGSLEVTGGTLSATGDKVPESSGNGLTLGDAVVLEAASSNYVGGVPTVTAFSGATVTSEKGEPVAIYKQADATGDVAPAFITGGNFNKAVPTELCGPDLASTRTANDVGYYTIAKRVAETMVEGKVEGYTSLSDLPDNTTSVTLVDRAAAGTSSSQVTVKASSLTDVTGSDAYDVADVLGGTFKMVSGEGGTKQLVYDLGVGGLTLRKATTGETAGPDGLLVEVTVKLAEEGAAPAASRTLKDCALTVISTSGAEKKTFTFEKALTFTNGECKVTIPYTETNFPMGTSRLTVSISKGETTPPAVEVEYPR